MSPQPTIPRWRGFNLTDLVDAQRSRSFHERDFEWMARWGFDFARLPLSYRIWTAEFDWTRIDEKRLEPIDQAIDWGREYGIHISLSFHRIPGYCINRRELEPYDLFEGSAQSTARALEAAAQHWRIFAKRYRNIDSVSLSFDLLNEPPPMRSQARYVEIVRTLMRAIREHSPDRLIIVDGADIGQTPVFELADAGVVQSTRGYLPKMLTHYRASWVPAAEFESLAPPSWPMTAADGTRWDAAELERQLMEPWKPLAEQGVPIHVGEWGACNTTPHAVTLAWMTDVLRLWQENGWGHALWNLRGAFGIVDSRRADVRYEKWQGHKLDREMLELLLRY